MCWRPLTPPLRSAVIYLVRSFRTNARIRSLTTGTFNRVVKDRIAFRLSGAPSVLDGPATRANPAVLETLQTYVAAQTLSTRASHRISTLFPQWERRLGRRPGSSASQKAGSSSDFQPDSERQCFRGGSLQRATVWPSALALRHTDFSAHAEAEDRKLRKDLTFGGSLL
jgi:hypothetical protein